MHPCRSTCPAKSVPTLYSSQSLEPTPRPSGLCNWNSKCNPILQRICWVTRCSDRDLRWSNVWYKSFLVTAVWLKTTMDVCMFCVYWLCRSHENTVGDALPTILTVMAELMYVSLLDLEELSGNFSCLESHPKLKKIKVSTRECSIVSMTSLLKLQQTSVFKVSERVCCTQNKVCFADFTSWTLYPYAINVCPWAVVPTKNNILVPGLCAKVTWWRICPDDVEVLLVLLSWLHSAKMVFDVNSSIHARDVPWKSTRPQDRLASETWCSKYRLDMTINSMSAQPQMHQYVLHLRLWEAFSQFWWLVVLNV